ncbi:hypothetical protein PtA15_6A694 [Puccinia triticina]|uniref:Uncharacterized protein n=1 Tax=Puccinia triticina TaxID=208348 RepID=A0ABY7CN14_9BASI|nr:uncharacterized protein PtA15_6A694 [Puccinia triticina]WAQ86064.1 hypothetical protein PtA15_6A694 [Puccinia triticina]
MYGNLGNVVRLIKAHISHLQTPKHQTNDNEKLYLHRHCHSCIGRFDNFAFNAVTFIAVIVIDVIIIVAITAIAGAGLVAVFK